MVPNPLLFYTYILFVLEIDFKSNIKVTAQTIIEYLFHKYKKKNMEIYSLEHSNNKWKSRVPVYHLVEKFGTASTKSYFTVNFFEIST